MIQKITLTEGCPNGCNYCYAPFTPIKYYDLPELTGDYIMFQDMNFLQHPKAKEILRSLPKGKYEFTCGIDYRRLDQEIANLMKEKGFVKIRWAWDYGFSQQKVQQKTLKTLLKAGYKAEELSVFVLVNWKIPFVECCQKLDLLKVWNVKVNDCCWDGGYKLAKPVYWTPEQIKRFRKMCRKHNQLVLFKIDPEYKSKNPDPNLNLFGDEK